MAPILTKLHHVDKHNFDLYKFVFTTYKHKYDFINVLVF